jgi:hypothetical protein
MPDAHGFEVNRRPQVSLEQTAMPILTARIARQGTTPS